MNIGTHTDSYLNLPQMDKEKVDEIIEGLQHKSVLEIKRLLSIARLEADARGSVNQTHRFQDRQS
jgi:hypothetical protein